MIPVKQTNAFVETQVDGERILLHLDSGHFHSLAGVSLVIWIAIDGNRSIHDIQAELSSHYAVDRARCDAEIAAFVDQLVQAGFVVAR